MGAFAASLAERKRTSVRLNLAELAVLGDAAARALEGRRRHRNPYLENACRRVLLAKERRRRAVERAAAR